MTTKETRHENEGITTALLQQVRRLSCSTLHDLWAVRQYLQSSREDLLKLQTQLSTPFSRHTADFDKQTLLTVKGLDEALEENKRRLQTFVSENFRIHKETCTGSTLYESVARQLNVTAELCRKSAIDFLLNNKDRYQNTVEFTLHEDAYTRTGYLQFLHAFALSALGEDCNETVEELREKGALLLDDYLRFKLNAEPEDFDRYCFWMTQDPHCGGSVEVAALSEVSRRPILIFRDHEEKGLSLSHVVNGNFAEAPLLLYWAQDSQFHGLTSKETAHFGI